MKKIAIAFVKFFSEESHARDFIAGKLYSQRLSYFKGLEGDRTRGDPNEGVAVWLQKEGLRIDFNVDKIGAFSVTEASGLAAPVSMSFAIHNDLNIFCISALTYQDFEIIDTEEEKETLLKKLNQEIKLDNRCFTEFGKYAVLVGGGKFVERLREKLPLLGHKYQFGYVDYYDHEVFNGEIPLNKVVFSKQKDYAYQREFRVCVNTETIGNDPKVFDMGDMSEFAFMIQPSQINDIELTMKNL